MIAAAGAGKTTYIVNEALKQIDNVLITTFTIENEAEIRSKFISICGYVPKNVTIQTWFSFLLQHGVKPYQGTCETNLFREKITGIVLVDSQSGIKYYAKGKYPVTYKEEDDFYKFYFTKELKIYTDKIAKFVCRANEKSKGNVIERIAKIYPHIYIDEIQDLSGYDLEIIKLLYHSQSNVLCVGDPRQVTYSTHWEKKNKKYRDGNIKDFVSEQCYKKDKIVIDEETLRFSHRNNQQICDFSSLLYPDYPPSLPCSCAECHPTTVSHQGIYLVKRKDVDDYMSIYKPVQLKYDISVNINTSYESYNFGSSKGQGFDRVLIYPTGKIQQWLFNNNTKLEKRTRAKLYVAITRARFSVAFVVNDDRCDKIQGIQIWQNEMHPTVT